MMKPKLNSLAALCMAILLIFSCSGCSYLTDAVDGLDLGDEPYLGDITTSDRGTEYVRIDDLVELRDYLWESVEDGADEMTFRYDGDSDDLDGQTIARILSAYYITIRQIPDAEDVWQVEYIGFPGDRIVAAYRSGDTSELTEDELAALRIAEEAVQEAQDHTYTQVDLELYLHDWLCEHIDYYDGSTDIEEGEVVPHLTAIGALLEGKANCQGYTDAFYVLASIAGFEVSRQCCENQSGGHCFNTICLDGDWYVVDVTFNDDFYSHEEQSYQDYRLFNAGRAECNEYSWPEEYEYHSLARKGGDLYYYNLSDETESELHRYTKRYDSLPKMADAVVEMWKEGRGVFHLMLSEQIVGWEDLNEILDEKLQSTGQPYSYRIWAFDSGEHTYFYIRFL